MLHCLLTDNRDEIIERCERRYRLRHPEHRSALLHTISRFIDELIQAERASTEEARAHGQQTFQSGYRIEQIAEDFGAICDVITELAIERNVELDARSYQLLNQCIDSGIAEAIATFFELSRARGDQEVAEWVGFLAHELRNSVSSAVMAYAVIRNGKVGLDSKTALVLDRSLRRIEALAGQTLTAVRLRGAVELDLQQVDVRELIEHIEAAAVPERGVHIVLDVARPLCMIADPGLVTSAVGNLVQNALKFTRAGGHVHVRGHASPDAIAIEVEDECGGLSDEDPSELFSPFVQKGSKARGVGLGLSITRQAIEAHGGRVSVRNVPGRGCVFKIWLPVPDQTPREQPVMDGRDACM